MNKDKFLPNSVQSGKEKRHTRGTATKSWPWLLGSQFIIFGPIELIF